MSNDFLNSEDPARRDLYAFNGGLLAKGPVRRILDLAGWNVKFGKPSADAKVGVWGASPTSPRGEAVAEYAGSEIVRIEDSFLRSLHPGRGGELPLGLLIDELGVHFDSAKPSALEQILLNEPFDDTAVLNRARAGIKFMAKHHLSKYSANDPDLDVPDAGFVLVIDQTRGDASIEGGGALSTTFKEMMVFAQTEHPDAQIVVKSHPETVAGHRDGHFTKENIPENATLVTDPVSPWRLFEHARAVYTVSSGLGFEAIIAGHKPRVFGQPFYAGWGLTADENPPARRGRILTRAQLFAGAMIHGSTWYDPYRDKLATLEVVLEILAAQAKAWREDRNGWVAVGMSKHKTRRLQQMFGGAKPVALSPPEDAITQAATLARPLMIWSTKMDDSFRLKAAQEGVPVYQVEDGFVRSRGLGAALVPAMSLALDRHGIHYDPLPESDLESLIQESSALSSTELTRARRLIGKIRKNALSKYNHGRAVDASQWPEGPKVLVVGQVEDDASVIKGCVDGISTNLELLDAARTGAPNAVIIYKPHPDVVSGLRRGAVDPSDLAELADVVLKDEDPASVLDHVEAVWTLTSLLGFEALLRGLPVTCVGTPFYAGWGLTRDFGRVSGRRTAKPTLEGLVHAALIQYPRYFDPVTKTACPVEVIVDRLAEGGETSGLRGQIWTLWRRVFPRSG